MLVQPMPSNPPLCQETGANSSFSPEGFDFAENLRARAERKSAAVLEPPRELPKPKAPDAFQERILKGDFYMD